DQADFRNLTGHGPHGAWDGRSAAARRRAISSSGARSRYRSKTGGTERIATKLTRPPPMRAPPAIGPAAIAVESDAIEEAVVVLPGAQRLVVERLSEQAQVRDDRDEVDLREDAVEHQERVVPRGRVG